MAVFGKMKTGQTFYRMFLNLGLSDVSSWLDPGYTFFSDAVSEVMLCSLHCILLGCTCYWFVPLLVLLSFITWLRWGLWNFFTVKLASSLKVSVCGEILWNYVIMPFFIPLSPPSFSIHWCFLPELIINEMLLNGWFCN